MTEHCKARTELAERIHALIDMRGPMETRLLKRDELLTDLREYQQARIPAYRRLLSVRGEDVALPTDTFRFTRVASHPSATDVRCFRTSGTSSGRRGEHHFQTLALYDHAAEVAARSLLFCGDAPTRLVVLAPTSSEVPDSSLSYMFRRFGDWFGTSTVHIWPLDAATLSRELRTDEPVALLGTSFAFMLMEDALSAMDAAPFQLPAGSFIMQTGGFKGRSREVSASAMLTLLSSRYGVASQAVVGEYGMTELSSQMYETTRWESLFGSASRPGEGAPDLLADTAQRRYAAPWWVKLTEVHPETLRPFKLDEDNPSLRPILRIDDAANLDSVSALQTSDFARVLARRGATESSLVSEPAADEASGKVRSRRAVQHRDFHTGAAPAVRTPEWSDEFVLLGRDAAAVPRGCSLAVEEAVSGPAGA